MNKHFTIFDASGEILRSGSCPEGAFLLQAQPGEFIVEAESDPLKDAVDPQTQQVVRGGRPPDPVKPEPYTVVRHRMYPSVEDQLDMIWHAMHDNILPRVEPMYSMILAVKEAAPKGGASDHVFEVGRG